MRRAPAWMWVMLIGLVLPACSTPTPPTPTEHFVTWSTQATAHTKRLCVLPFESQSRIQGLAERVRQAVAGRLSIKRFADTELHEIDAHLADLRDWRKFSPQAVGRRLKCDALVYGRVSELDRVYLLVYSQLALEGTLQVVDSATGRTLVHEMYTTRFHDAGLPLSPFTLATIAVQNLWTYSGVQLSRAIDDLSRNLAAKVPDLPDSAG